MYYQCITGWGKLVGNIKNGYAGRKRGLIPLTKIWQPGDSIKLYGIPDEILDQITESGVIVYE